LEFGKTIEFDIGTIILCFDDLQREKPNYAMHKSYKNNWYK